MSGRRSSVWTGAIIAALTVVAPASSQTRQTQPAQQTPPAQQSPFTQALSQLQKAVGQFQQAQQTTPPPRQPGTTAPPPRNPPPGAGGVDWQSAVAYSRRTAKAGDTLAAGLDKAALDRTQVPILLPNDAALLAGARLYSFGDQYTLSADIPGGGVSLTGTTAVVATTTKLNVSAQGPMQLVLQRTVDGYLASFTRFGVLYTVEVRCDSPKDERCRSEAFVKDLTAKTTVVVLGKAARQAAGMGG